MAEKKVFVRKATGLVREIGFLTAILIVVCNMVGLGWQKRRFQFTGPAIVPENSYFLGLPPIVMAFIIVGVVVLLTVWVFAILGAAMPRSGGGYVYISRILSPSIGFLASWTEFFSIAVSYGLIGTAVFEAILIYSKLAKLPSDLINTLATPEVLLIGGMVIVVLFALLATMGVRMAGMLLQIMFWVPAAITVLIYGMLLTATPSTLTSGIQSFAGQSPTAFTNLAISQGMDVPYSGGYWGAVNYAALGAYWAYIGFAASTFVAGEIKEVAKNLPKTLFVANSFVIFLYISISALVARAAMMVGQVTVTATGNTYSFFSAYSFMSYGGGTLTGIAAALPKAWMPNIAAFIAFGNGMDWLPFLVLVFAAFWVANDIPPFILTSSRIIFAMAFDRVLPEKFAEVNERWHSPIWAVIFVMLVAFIGNFAESDVFPKWFGADNILSKFINSGGGVVATDIWDTIFFLLAAVAGLMFVFRRKDIYERSSYKPSIGGMPLVTIIGLLATIGNLWLLYAVASGYGLTYPEVWYFTIILLAIGAIIYFYYRGKGTRTGVDYGTIYAEIPPE